MVKGIRKNLKGRLYRSMSAAKGKIINHVALVKMIIPF